MAILVHQCPHPDCLAERMTFDVVALTHAPGATPQEVRSFAHLACRQCRQPSAAEIEGDSHGIAPNVMQYGVDLATLQWRIVRIWPAPPTPRTPDHLPAEVARAFTAAEKNFAQRDMEEASAGSYGRALELATKAIAPELAAKPLYNRIETLAAQHRITVDLKEWAHAIRFIRNSAMHDVENIAREELVAIRGFTELVLTYLFTLPGMLRARQGEVGKRSDPRDS